MAWFKFEIRTVVVQTYICVIGLSVPCLEKSDTVIKIDFFSPSEVLKRFSGQGELAFKFLSQHSLDKLMDETQIKIFQMRH